VVSKKQKQKQKHTGSPRATGSRRRVIIIATRYVIVINLQQREATMPPLQFYIAIACVTNRGRQVASPTTLFSDGYA